MDNRSTLQLMALGGLGEIGMNCLVLETEGRRLLVDCGVMFPEEETGVEVVHPSFDGLADRADCIEGVWITHGHEDHIGAVPYLLERFDVPVYAPPYAAGLLREKLRERTLPFAPRIHATPDGEAVTLGPFRLTSLQVAHSIIDATALLAETPAGTILHTGDFKLGLDGDGPAGSPTLGRLRSVLPSSGLDLLLSDSTGAEESGATGPESGVIERLDEILAGAQGRVFVALFSSNVERLEAVARLGVKHGRRVALAGRSVQLHTRVATELGRLRLPVERLVSPEDAARFPREQLLVIISGTQGEPRSNLVRLAEGSHRFLTIAEGDLVILSSRFIPGNEVAIGRMIDGLIRQGAQVIHHLLDPRIHVSGHGRSDDQRLLIEAVRPRCFMPVHGTLRHLVAHAGLARRSGVPQVELMENGQVIELSSHGLRRLDRRIPVGRMHVDGAGGLSEMVIRERRHLGDRGIVVAVLQIDPEKGCLRQPPEIITRGVVQAEAEPAFLAEATSALVKEFRDAPAAALSQPDAVRELARRVLKRYVTRTLDRQPVIVPVILGPAEEA